MSFRDDRLRLLDILTAIDEIERHIGGRSKSAFVADKTAVDGVAYRLVIIGEPVASLPTDLLTLEPKIPWAEVRALCKSIGPCLFRNRFGYRVKHRKDRSRAVAGSHATTLEARFAEDTVDNEPVAPVRANPVAFAQTGGNK